jgi:glycosyltransferase involved in cell wall biosynthesis
VSDYETPLVSVIIPTYRRPEALGRAIDGVRGQTYTRWEVLVVDDNPPESGHRRDTEAFMARYAGEPRIRYLKHQANLGAPRARNTGLGAARGRYVCFLDDDDDYMPDKLDAQVEAFAAGRCENTAIVYCRARYVDAEGRTLRYSVVESRGEVLAEHLVRNIATTTTMMFRRDVLKEVGGFRDLICGQEYDLTLRILALGYAADFVPRVLVRVYMHAEERISTGARKIEGVKALHEIKRPYLKRADARTVARVENHFFLSLYREYLAAGRRGEALASWKQARRADPGNPANYLELLALLVGYSALVSLKKLLHVLKNKVR